MARRDPKPPEVCPVCGEDVPPRALACPECGADDLSGWRENAMLYDGVDIPGGYEEPGENYEEFMRREFGPRWNWWPPNIKWLWWITAAILLAGLVWGSGLGAILLHAQN